MVDRLVLETLRVAVLYPEGSRSPLLLPVPYHLPRSLAHLYRLTVRLKDTTVDVYVMATSIETAFNRYLDWIGNRKETTLGVVLVRGELANPHAS